MKIKKVFNNKNYKSNENINEYKNKYQRKKI